MTSAAMFTLAVVTVAVALLVSERLRADVVALLVAVVLGLVGILSPREAFSGFATSAVVTIVSVFVLTEALHVAGTTDRAGHWLAHVAGTSERKLVVVIMVAGALLSLLMNNIAAAAILLPAVSGLAHRNRIDAGHLLMPLAFATILGGTATLFTTTNIIVSGVLRGQNLPGFGVLDFAPVGIPIAAAGILYMVLWGRRLLHQPPTPATVHGSDAQPLDLAEVYRLRERIFPVRVPVDSSLIGQTLSHSGLRALGANVVTLERGHQIIHAPSADTTLHQGDVLFLEARLAEFRADGGLSSLELLPAAAWSTDLLRTDTVTVVEAVLAPRSTLLGQTLRTTEFREKYGMNVLGIWRSGQPTRTNLSDLPLALGDALLLHGPRDRIRLLVSEPNLIVLEEEDTERPILSTRWRRWLAPVILLVALILAAFNTALVGEIMLAAALLTVLSGILTMDQAYSAIEWRSVFLVGGMLPLGLAMTKSGAAAWLADQLIVVVGPAGPLGLLAGVFLLTALLSQAMYGAAVATVVAPIAIGVAQQTGLDPRAMAMAVAVGSSMTFLSPLGHPVNVLVMGPGGYKFNTYFKVGWPLVVISFVLVMLLLPVFWPLTVSPAG